MSEGINLERKKLYEKSAEYFECFINCLDKLERDAFIQLIQQKLYIYADASRKEAEIIRQQRNEERRDPLSNPENKKATEDLMKKIFK